MQMHMARSGQKHVSIEIEMKISSFFVYNSMASHDVVVTFRRQWVILVRAHTLVELTRSRSCGT